MVELFEGVEIRLTPLKNNIRGRVLKTTFRGKPRFQPKRRLA